MGFVSFPLRIKDGRLDATAERAQSIVWLLDLMTSTSEGSWRGSAEFGLREALVAAQAKYDARLVIIRRINQSLLDLGIDWVRVESIEPVTAKELGSLAYLLTLSYRGKGTEVHQIEL